MCCKLGICVGATLYFFVILMTSIGRSSVSHSYADDTVLSCASPEAKLPNTQLHEKLVKFTDWLASNKLTLNTEKSNT